MKHSKLIIITFFLALICWLQPVYAQGGFWDGLFSRSTRSTTFNHYFDVSGSIMFQENSKKLLGGINLKLRTTPDDYGSAPVYAITFGGSYFFPQTHQKDGVFTAFPNPSLATDTISIPYRYKEQLSYLTVDLGFDFYLFSQEETPFAMYMGMIAGLGVPFYKNEYRLEEYDASKYVLQVDNHWKPTRKDSPLFFKLGFDLGVEWTFDQYRENMKNIEKSPFIEHQIYLEASGFYGWQNHGKLEYYYDHISRFFVLLSVGYRVQL